MNLNSINSIIKVAHRGVPSLIPENTIASYKYALTLNIDMLEIDIHRTKDGKLVVMHDPTTERTTLEQGTIKDLTYDELLKYDIGKWKGEKFIVERIPLLQEVLQLINPTNIKLLIEDKHPDKYPGIEEELINEIIKTGLDINRIIIQSFDRNSVKKVRELNKNIKLGVLISKRHRIIRNDTIQKISEYAQYLNPNYKLLTKGFVKSIHAHGLKILPYTVNDYHNFVRMIEIGVDGVITDYPQSLSEWLNE